MASGKVGIAICTLNQLCLDFESNLDRIVQSIEQSIELGASIRIGPELEVTGYGCEDAFYEIDTVFHSWQVVGEILKKNYRDILINLGMPVLKDGSLYNCIVVIFNSNIVYIRAKNRLALTGNYRENRWFTAWGNGEHGSLSWLELPSSIYKINGQKRVPIGDGAILEIVNRNSDQQDLQSSLNTIRIGYEVCEELWQINTQNQKHFGLRGCHLVVNVSSSYWELRKLDSAFTHAKSATHKTGGVYAYVNNLGCDGGGRLCSYGRSFIVENGELLSMSNTQRNELFNEVKVSVIHVDPCHIQQYRLQKNIKIHSFTVHDCCLDLSPSNNLLFASSSSKVDDIFNVNVISFESSHFFKNHPGSTKPCIIEINISSEEEIMRYCCLWLWDYLRRCIDGGLKGFIVPLSGGLDSSSVVCIVYCLCQMLHQQIYVEQNEQIASAIEPIFDWSKYPKATPKDFCRHLLRCCYLQTKFSSSESLKRAKNLAELVGAEFQIYNFDKVFQLMAETLPLNITSLQSDQVTIQQQNIQARLRMVITYYMSQCNRLVLATGNVDEALVGYFTKYDCSSADLNPIGSISKNDLKKFVHFCKKIISDSDSILDEIILATPSAELTGADQKDEDDLGLTYDELSLFGKTRRGHLGTYGPYGMFCTIWDNRFSNDVRGVFDRYTESTVGFKDLDPVFLANKVKRFFTLYGRNRHKQTILTPSLHTETYSPDDNRFDHRQFLFNNKWPWQFSQIDEKVKIILNSMPS